MAVYDFKSLKLYLDGKLVDQAPCSSVFYRGNSIMRLSGLPGGNSELQSRTPGRDSFRGNIKRVGYYGWPLSDGKVPTTPIR